VTRSSARPILRPALLGLDCGATRSVALFVQGRRTHRVEGGPANVKLLGDAALVRHLLSLRAAWPAGLAPQAIALMLSEDAKIPRALLAERRSVARGVRLIVRALRQGGRLFYVGAGTSGRLGVLDASECPPTFGTWPDLVQGLIAGGPLALWSSVEGAEDDAPAGALALARRGLTRRDIVVGIAASGRPPFVWGALGEARRRGAATILLCFNPYLKVPRAQRPTLMMAPNLGPEVLTGSTRLKAGTPTKLVLNIFTTLAMVRLGKVTSNLMTEVAASNVKLRHRAVCMVRELSGAGGERARAALEQSNWTVQAALRGLRGRARGTLSL
jgi:N-acetylmuramic acid 6-phosphate etherase